MGASQLMPTSSVYTGSAIEMTEITAKVPSVLLSPGYN